MEFRVSSENRPMKHARLLVIYHMEEVILNEKDKNTCDFCGTSGAERREHGSGVEVAHRNCGTADEFELGGSD